jgi:predicted Zn-dependent protease
LRWAPTRRAAAASAGGIVGSLSQSQLGDLGEKLVNSQFSQRQESEADDYSYDLLRKRGINPSGLATSFEKLANWKQDAKAPCLTITQPQKSVRNIFAIAWPQTESNNVRRHFLQKWRA